MNHEDKPRAWPFLLLGCALVAWAGIIFIYWLLSGVSGP